MTLKELRPGAPTAPAASYYIWNKQWEDLEVKG